MPWGIGSKALGSAAPDRRPPAGGCNFSRCLGPARPDCRTYPPVQLSPSSCLALFRPQVFCDVTFHSWDSPGSLHVEVRQRQARCHFRFMRPIRPTPAAPACDSRSSPTCSYEAPSTTEAFRKLPYSEATITARKFRKPKAESTSCGRAVCASAISKLPSQLTRTFVELG